MADLALARASTKALHSTTHRSTVLLNPMAPGMYRHPRGRPQWQHPRQAGRVAEVLTRCVGIGHLGGTPFAGA